MIKTSLEFEPNTTDRVKGIIQNFPPYDMLVAYRRAVYEFKSNDIVLLVAVKDEEPVAFEARVRQEYIAQAFNTPAKKLHPMARQTAHRRMRMPIEAPAFWIVVELRDHDMVVSCAVGAITINESAVAPS